MTTTEPRVRPQRQLPALVRAAHPRQAVAFAVAVAALVLLTRNEALREAAVAGLAVLLAQLIMGLTNDLLDVDLDRASTAQDKPIATGVVPPGNASFVAAVLLLLVIPLALQNGTVAGCFLLATLPVGYVHDRWLHRTALSFVGWAATFALLLCFVTYGGWGRDADGSAPLERILALSAALGICVHVLLSLPDLVRDNQGRVRHLPLRIALHTGAPRLLVLTLLVTLAVLGALVWTALQAGAIAH